MAEESKADRGRRGSITELEGKDDKTKFADLCQIGVYRQAKWFLKTYWNRAPLKLKENPERAEHIYTAARDLKKRCDKGQNELEQLGAHHFLEKIDAAITYTAFKKKFKDLDLDFNNKLSLTEYLVYKFDLGETKLISELVNAKQVVVAGLAAAETEMEECQAAYEENQEAHDLVLKVSAEIKALQDAHTEQIAKHEKNIEKHAGKIVKQNIHKKKLAVHNNNEAVDNKTRITQKAAERRSKKAVKKLRKELDKAEAMVEEIKNSGITAEAVLWWMERNLKEMEKTMSKKQYAKKQAKIEAKKKDAGLA